MPHTMNPFGSFTVRENGLWLSDTTAADVSTSKHGLAPKLPNDATKYLDGVGGYSVPAGSGGWAVLFDSTLGADTATIDTGAGGVPAGYKALRIYLLGRTDEAVQSSGVQLNFNGDTANNYCRQYTGSSSTSSVTGNGTADAGVMFPYPGSSHLANAAAAYVADIVSYTGTTFLKTGLLVGGMSDTSGANGQNYTLTFTWRNTGAITQIVLSTTTAGKKLVTGSRMLILGR